MRRFLSDQLAGSRFEPAVRSVYRVLARRPETPLERRTRAYDAMTVQIIRRVMRPDSNSVDAGANRGYFLKQLLRAAPTGTHYAFEPIPELAAQLQRRFPAAKVEAVALGAEDRSATFHYLPDKPAQSSLYHRAERERGQRVVELTVPVRRLDDIWPADVPLTFVKIDVEGAKQELLDGARQILTRWRPVLVIESDPNLLPALADQVGDCGLTVSLLSDFCSGVQRPLPEVLQRAVDDGEWYFTAARK